MRKMTMSESQYGAPAGIYRTRFVGVKENDHPEFGAGLQWEFEVLDGMYKGKVVSRTTAPSPTLKNSCGKMLVSLSGSAINKDQEIDVDSFVGQIYQVMVEPNSTGNGTRVGTVMPYGANTPAQAPAPPKGNGSAPKTPPPPPKAPSGPATPSPAMVTRYWVQQRDGKVEEMTTNKIQELIDAGAPAHELPVMSLDQVGGWKTASDFGFKVGQAPF